jgi:hypothetical protein
MKAQLTVYGYDIKLIGGLQERGYTSHDIDLDVSMPHSQPPNGDVFLIINEYGNEFWEKYRLELDLNLSFEGKPKYKLDKGGFFEYQDDGSLEPTSF